VGARLGLDEPELDCLEFLVRHHLFLPENALRRDLEDPDFIEQSAALIGDLDRLTMLYLLSVADSRATGPSAWSDWKASLLQDFFLRLKSVLEEWSVADRKHIPLVERDEEARRWLEEKIREHLPQGFEPAMALDRLPSSYLAAFTPEAVAHHLRLHREELDRLQQQIRIFPERRHGYWSLLVMTADRPGLLAKLCGVLALHNLEVLAAQVFTWTDGTVVDVLDVRPVHKEADYEELDWAKLAQDLNSALAYRLDVAGRLHQKLHNHRRPVLGKRLQQIEHKVLIDNDVSRDFTLIEVHGADRPGILYQLTQNLADCGLDIHRARIATEVDQLIDVFYVLERGGGKLVDKERQEKVRRTLLRVVAPDPVAE